MPAAPVSQPTCIDVRTVSPPARHPLIFGRFDALAPGEALELLNDHEPAPLRAQFERSRYGQFSWQTLQAGPEIWQVRIERIAAGQPGAPTAGCGGACACGGA